MLAGKQLAFIFRLRVQFGFSGLQCQGQSSLKQRRLTEMHLLFWLALNDRIMLSPLLAKYLTLSSSF